MDEAPADPPLPPLPPDHKPERLNIRVGLPGGAVHSLDLDQRAPLSNVVDRVLQAENLDPALFRIRLISAGRLYSDHTRLVKDVVDDGGFLHCAVSDVPPPPPSPPSHPAASHPASLRDSDDEHRLLLDHPGPARGASLPDTAPHRTRGGDPVRDARERDAAPLVLEAFNVDGEVRIIIPEQPSRAAYDRLADAGLSADEIRMIRRHFRVLRREARIRQEAARDEEAGGGSGDAGSTTERSADDPTGATATELRDAPMLRAPRRDEQHHSFVFASGGEGTNSDFLMGCIFGYLLGIIVLVLLLDTNATRRWRVGIIAGVATNCAFGILRTSLYLQSSFHTP